MALCTGRLDSQEEIYMVCGSWGCDKFESPVASNTRDLDQMGMGGGGG